MRLIGIGLIVPFLTLGCTGETDPAKAGLFDNLNNLATGEYERQQQERDRQIAAAQASNEQTRDRIDSLSSQRASNNAQISSIRNQLNSARAANANNAAALAELAQLESQLNAAEANNVAGTPSVIAGELDVIGATLDSIGS